LTDRRRSRTVRITVPRTISVAVDDELFIRLDHAIASEAARLGVPKIAKSLYLRRLIARGLDDPRPMFDQGYLEGFRAGFAATMRHVAGSLQDLIKDPSKVDGLGLGMSAPYDERGG
jgi:hypothetical protein